MDGIPALVRLQVRSKLRICRAAVNFKIYLRVSPIKGDESIRALSTCLKRNGDARMHPRVSSLRLKTLCRWSTCVICSVQSRKKYKSGTKVDELCEKQQLRHDIVLY